MNSSEGMTVLILAGGDGRRMGGSKPMQALRGQTLVEHSLYKARQWSSNIIISVRRLDQVPASEHLVLVDPLGIVGPLAGISAVRSLGCRTVLTIPCDMPFLPDDLPLQLQAAIGENGAALVASEGRVHPVCGLWQGKRLAELDDYLESGRRSMIGFAEHIGYITVELGSEAGFNINTPGDLTKAESGLS